MAALEIQDLLRAIDEDFDTLEHWHPLADWLIERDDPRGELINIDLAIEAGEGDLSPLVARRIEILGESAPKLLGETFSRVVADRYAQVTWRRGFVDEVEYMGSSSLRHRKSVGWLIKLMLTVHEPFAFLRKLDLAYTDIADVTPLVKFSHLVDLNLVGCQPTKASLEILHAQLPGLEIRTR